MSGTKIIIDLFGMAFSIYIGMLFYGTFWHLKILKKRFYILGFSLLAVLDLVNTRFFENHIISVILSMAILFLIGIYYEKSLSSWLLMAFILSVLFFISEIAIALVQTSLLGIPIEYIQSRNVAYAIGLLSTKLLSLVLIYLIRLLMPPQKGAVYNKWFNLPMLILPFQSLILCFLVLELSFVAKNSTATLIGEIAIFISLIIILVTMFIIQNQLKIMVYKNRFENAQKIWQLQLNHYDALYTTQKEIRSIRHDMNSTLIILSGLLEKGKVNEALIQLSNIQNRVLKTDNIVDMGYPAVDAILSAFIAKANDLNISIDDKIIVEKLYIDQCDLAMLLANALENAFDAISKSTDIEKKIFLSITDKSDYLHIWIKNQTSVEVNINFQTTKNDKINHGFGLQNMGSIAKKYDGYCNASYDKESRTFSVEILMKNQESSPLVT